LERENEAAVALVNHSERIAKDVLKENDIKVYKGARRRAIHFDPHSYEKGIVDSKEVDIDQRAIRQEAVKVKKEKTWR
jgi:hypothetical protein